MMSIVIMDVWKNAGFFMIIFIAALQGVPKAILEAAVMDGASYWRRFFRIVLPWISPVVFFAIVYASIGALQVFESIVILTRGGPGDATRSMSILIVEEAFDSFEIGYAAAIAVVMTVVILIITVIQFAASRALGSPMRAQSKASQRALDWAIIAVMVALGVFMLLPFAWLFSMSFRTVKDAYQMPPSFLPPRLDFDNYRAVLSSSIPFLQIYANSVEVAVIVTISQLITCTLAAFAFARLNFPGRDSLFFVMLIGLLFPAQVTIIPIYLGYTRIGLINRPIGLALMYLTSSFGVFLVRQFMQLAAQGARRGRADGWRGLFQDLLPHFLAAVEARIGVARHHHLHADLELLFPGARAARTAGLDDLADRDGRAARLSRIRQPCAGDGGDEHVGPAGHSSLSPRSENGDRRHSAERNQDLRE